MESKNKNDFKLDFIGIGAAKCATTWVYQCLLEHPRICGPYRKELNFFITKKPTWGNTNIEHRKYLYNRGISYYKKYFSHCMANAVKGEYSVSYFNGPGAAQLIKKHFPNVKLLVCLRDPVKRAYSHYLFAKEFLLLEKSQTFEEALKNHPEIYIEWSMYYKQLKNYLELFPKKNIGIFLIEDLKKNPVTFMKKIYEFLGVENDFVPPSAFEKENVAKKTKSKFVKKIINEIAKASIFLRKLHLYFIVDFLRKLGVENLVVYINNKLNIESFQKPPLNPVTERYLRNIFREDIEKLESLLKRDLSLWK